MEDTSTTYIHTTPPSFQAKAMQSLFGLFGLKKGGLILKAANQAKSSETPAPIPKRMRKKFRVNETLVQGRKVWTIQPKTTTNNNKVVLYFHGGVYLFSINNFHWKFVETLIQRTGATFVVPDYPLAPEATCEESLSFGHQVYEGILVDHSSEDIVVLGDSAGAGLALALAMDLKQQNDSPPSHLMLLSPWLDVTMSNPDIVAIDAKDKIMGIAPLRTAGKVYAGSLPTDDYRVSPIYGDLSAVPNISVFVGTYDLFVADARKLKKRAESAGVALHYFEYPKMFHGWFMMGNMKESKVAIQQMCAFLKEK